MHSASASVLLQTTVLLQLLYLECTSAVPLLFPSCPASDLALLLSPFWSETEIFLRHLHLQVIAHALVYSTFFRSSKLDGGPYFFLPDGILKFRQMHISTPSQKKLCQISRPLSSCKLTFAFSSPSPLLVPSRSSCNMPEAEIFWRPGDHGCFF